MAYKSFKPYTTGRRQMTVSAFDEITTDTQENLFWRLFIITVVVTAPAK